MSLCAGVGIQSIFGWMNSIWMSVSHQEWTLLNQYAGEAFEVGVGISVGVVAWQLRAIAVEVCEGVTVPQAARAAMKETVVPGTLAFLIASVIALVPLFGSLVTETSREAARFEVLAIAAALVSIAVLMLECFVLLPLVITYLSLGEAFIERTNRLRERFGRFFQLLEKITEPRWSLSITGSAPVLFAIVFFDRTSLAGHEEFAVWAVWRLGALPLVMAAAVVLMIGLLYLKNVRLTVAWVVTALYFSTIAVWMAWHLGYARIGDLPDFGFGLDGLPDYPGWELIAPFYAMIACVCLLYANRMLAARKIEDTAVTISRVALSETGDTIVFIGAVFTLACLFRPSVFVPALSVAAALAFFPAAYVSIETLFPRYRSVEEVFGKR